MPPGGGGEGGLVCLPIQYLQPNIQFRAGDNIRVCCNYYRLGLCIHHYNGLSWDQRECLQDIYTLQLFANIYRERIYVEQIYRERMMARRTSQEPMLGVI